MKGQEGIPYSVGELRAAATGAKTAVCPVDPYYIELMSWAAQEIERLEDRVTRLQDKLGTDHWLSNDSRWK